MEIHNAGEVIPEFFFQVDYSLEPVSDETAYLNVFRSRQRSDPENPQLWILPKVRGCGQYVGTYLAWSQSHPGWWGEGEVKFFIDSDPDDAPTICGTGLEDYVGGAYCFAMELPRNQHPTTYSSMFLGHPQSIADPPGSPRIARHALYRWHVPDPVRFDSDLRVSVQALGWNSRGTYQPLADELTSVVYWYQVAPASG